MGAKISIRAKSKSFCSRIPPRASGLFGVPDAKYGEELCAWVKLKPGRVSGEELRQYCRGELAHYKVPRYVKFVNEFPQTVTGKIQKYKIRELMIAELGLSEAETA